MDLLPVGITQTDPKTFFFWHPNDNTLVEITDLQRQAYLVTATKSYYLLKQSEEGRRTQNQKLNHLNDYLAEKFNQFQIRQDYTNTAAIEPTGVNQQIESAVENGEQLRRETDELRDQLENLELQSEHGLEQFQDVVEDRLEGVRQELKENEEKLEKVNDRLEERLEVRDQWRKNGVSQSLTFSFSADPLICPPMQLENVVRDQIEEVRALDHSHIENTLVRGNFELYVEEMAQPRVFHRLEHSVLIQPDAYEQLRQDYPDLNELLTNLRQRTVAQYQTYALNDIETELGTREQAHATPAQATRSLLNQLDTIPQTTANPPNNGPWIGTITGTQQVIGFDPADNTQHGIEHYYIVGKTGSGKTYLKRVLLENAATLNYNILSIMPDDGDTEGIGLNLPNQDHENGQAINANQYYPNHQDYPDIPDDLNQLLNGINVVTLSGIEEAQKQEFVYQIFNHVNSLNKLSNPLFIFLEEAHNFTEGDALEAIEKVSRQGRKFGVTLCLVTQSPTDFAYDGAKVREQLNHIFMKGKYGSYADKWLSKGSERISQLNTGNALFFDWDYDEAIVDIRQPLTHVEIGESNQYVKKVAEQFQKQEPDFSSKADQTHSAQGEINPQNFKAQLNDEQTHILETVRQYIHSHDQAPTYRKTIEHSNFGSTRTKRVLNELVDMNLLTKKSDVRGGQQTDVYCPPK